MKRLRPKYSDEELAELYRVPHDHTKWPDHIHRVNETIRLANDWLVPADNVYGADLSCGDGAILSGLNVHVKLYGDYAPGYDFVGPIEETIKELPMVDVFVCCETLEHLDDPMTVLHGIRQKTDRLILSTPDTLDDNNHEHYWSWTKEDVYEMLRVANFLPIRYHSIRLNGHGGYTYQLWLCT